jgi:glyoxylase-like metal-dependent hydrolase (beta-lactamase superfamily II)/rhodanese-related sulfurtransferase
VEIVGIRTPGLGDTSYLLHHDGVGVLVDPQRDVERFLTAARDVDVDVRFVLETHLHNDYVSGGREAARATGAELVLPASAGVAFDHTPAFHHEELGHGSVTVRPIHTPGHTPEHTSYLVFVEGEPVALFSGGSLLVGSAGRTDLLGEQRARQLARLQFSSVSRLAALPDRVGLHPTHGAGSFCTASAVGRSTSTIGDEKRTNPVLSYRHVDEFVESQLAGLQPYPSYYAHMGPINLLGPEPPPNRDVPYLTAEQVHALGSSAQVVDARPRADFASGHIPGSLGIELQNDFGVWVGWLVPFDSPIVLVLDPDQDADEAIVQLARIGFDHVAGIVKDLGEWQDTLAGYPTVAVPDLFTGEPPPESRLLLDVRSPAEWEGGHVPGSIHRYVPDLIEGPGEDLDPTLPVTLICATGYRATIAAGLLERHGYRPVVVAKGGVADVLRSRPSGRLYQVRPAERPAVSSTGEPTGAS